MDRREVAIAVVVGLLAAMPWLVAAGEESAHPGRHANDSYEQTAWAVDFAAVIMLLVLPLALAWARRPVQAGVAAGAIAAVGVLAYNLALARSGWLPGTAPDASITRNFVYAMARVLLPVALGALAGAWTSLATGRPMPGWTAGACVASLVGIWFGLLGSGFEGSTSFLGALPWLALVVLALGTAVVVALRRRAPPSAEDADAVRL